MKDVVRIREKDNRRRKEQTNYIKSLIMGVICFLILLYIVGDAIMPEKYDLNAGDLADTNIAATREIEDKEATLKRKEEARNRITPIITYDGAVISNVTNGITSAFESVKSVYDQGNSIRNQWLTENPGETKEGYVFSTSIINNFMTMLPFDTDHQEVLNLIDLKADEIENAKSAILNTATNLLNEGIDESKLKDTKKNFAGNISEGSNFSSVILNIINKIADKTLQANKIYDPVITEEARKKAADEVEPVIFLKGQNIVEKGTIVTEAQYNMLKELGLIKNDDVMDYKLYIGMGVLLLILLTVIALYIKVYERETLQEPKKVLLLGVIIVISTLLSAVMRNIEPMLIQLTFGTILIAVLLHTRLALITNAITSIIAGMMISDTTGMFSARAISVTLVLIVAGSVAVFMCKKPMHRMRIMATGLLVGMAGMATSVAIGLILYGSIMDILKNSLWALGGGVFSAVLCVGTLPVWEAMFDILTPTKLLEITNPNQPLLRRLVLEAPGTHHHSIVVANLAEAGAEVIGANTMLVRAGAYYHDVGKLNAPECYAENQTDKETNFHSLLTPFESASIIRSHTTDGNELALKYKLPKEIRDIILQHQGTTPIYYFYAKALEEQDDVDIKDYSYAGPKPTSREAALIMIADSVEAAVRSLHEKTPEAVRAKIDEIIKDRLANGEFDNCAISMLDLNKIAQEFTQVLSAVHHERIEYPDLKKALEKQAERKALADGVKENKHAD